MSDILLVWARGFHFGSGMILIGVVAFRWLVLLPAFAGESEESWQKFAPLMCRLHRLYLSAAAVLIVSSLALFWAVAAEMSGTSLRESLSSDTLGTVFFQTQFGAICQWRLGVLAIFLLMLARLAWDSWLFQRVISPLEMVAGLFTGALVVSIAFTGHAAATGGFAFWWRVPADAAHLFAAAIWPTGLLPFALLLGGVPPFDELDQLRPVLIATNRFSNLSFLTVGVLALTGMINAFAIVGSIPALLTTEYGRLLSLKLVVFFIMLMIAAWNRYRLVPLVFRKSATSEGNQALALLRRLRRFVLIEFGLAVAVVAIVSMLGTTAPPG